jgi:hypothetical protein
MDAFLQGCQGIGLALAVGAAGGAIAGALSGARPLGGPVLYLPGALAVVGGALLFGASLAAEDHPAWPGWIVGALIGLGAFGLTAVVVAAAGRRTGEGGSGGSLAAIVIIFALVLAGLSVLVPPVSLLALLGALWLALSRRRAASRKYEGLRVLR